MSDEYEYGPWIDVPEGCELQFEPLYGGPRRYRIATPKPKRELVVGKWYLRKGNWWSQVVAVFGEDVWLTRCADSNAASRWETEAASDLIDWSTPPRDEAPE